MADREIQRLEKADLGGGELVIPNPLREGVCLRVPERLRLREGALSTGYVELQWQWTGNDPEVPAAQLPSLLREFTRLVDATPERVLAFAQRWGVLGICLAHEQPTADDGQISYYDPTAASNRFSPSCGGDDFPLGDQRYRVWEDIDSPICSASVEPWRSAARQIRAICGVIADLQSEEPCRAEEWEIVADLIRQGTHAIYRRPLFELQVPGRWEYGLLGPELDRHRLSRAQQRERVAYAVNMWLEFGGARAVVDWGIGTPRVLLIADNLVGILAIQLAAAVSSPFGIWRCDGVACDQLIETQSLKRNPQGGRNHFCVACREGDRASKLLSARRRRAKPS
jgi:hypothetical protein